jgi:hypothetical protein
MVTIPQEDTAEKCADHPECIWAFKRMALGVKRGLAGEWHLMWDEEGSRWDMTQPDGGKREIRVSPDIHPVAALGEHDLRFDRIRIDIMHKGLFPPS